MKLLHTLFFSLLVSAGFSQNKEGIVTYESIVKIDVSRFPPEMKGMIPPERKSMNQLIFSEKEAIYKAIREEEDSNREVTSGHGMQIRIKMQGASDNEYYTNLEEGSALDKNEFFGRTFLIEGGEPIKWKMTNEMKVISGYQCMKATYMRDTIPISAWFTPQIPVSIGPGQYSGLPGLVLSVDINEGQRTILATDIDLRTLSEEEVIVAPEKGKKVTREQFRKIQKEKMEEMEEMNGGRGGAFIIRN